MNMKLFFTSFLTAFLAGSAPHGALAADPPAAQKVIKDAAEYNSYIAALKLTDPVAKAAAMEAFIVAYPASIVKDDALEQAMAAYQQLGDAKQLESAAQRLLTLEPDHLRALAILTVIERNAASSGDASALAAMRVHAERGLRILPTWPKPEGTSEADFAKLRSQMGVIFNGANGLSLLNAKNYADARDAYLKAIAIDATDMQNFYQLGLAEVQMTPPDANGFWHLARAMALASTQNNAVGTAGIEKYARAKYRYYHGGEDGWDAIVTAAATQTALPDSFAASIKPGPTPAEIAVQAVHDNDPATLSFADWEFVLSLRDASPANKAAADKVWAAIQTQQRNGTVQLKIPVMVVAATATMIDAAITDENIAAKKIDVHIVMADKLAKLPVPGETVNIIGLITAYTPKPFLFTMTQGHL